jgi:hypothetical protein
MILSLPSKIGPLYLVPGESHWPPDLPGATGALALGLRLWNSTRPETTLSKEILYCIDKLDNDGPRPPSTDWQQLSY